MSFDAKPLSSSTPLTLTSDLPRVSITCSRAAQSGTLPSLTNQVTGTPVCASMAQI